MDFPLSDRDRERWEAVEAAYQRLIDADDPDVLQCWIYSVMDYGGWVVDEMCELEDWLECLQGDIPVRSEDFDGDAAYFYSDFERIYSAYHLRDTPMDADDLAGEALQVGQEFEIDEITELLETA